MLYKTKYKKKAKTNKKPKQTKNQTIKKPKMYKYLNTHRQSLFLHL